MSSFKLCRWATSENAPAGSGKLIETNANPDEDARDYYMRQPSIRSPPYIVHSSFVSSRMVDHLMRNKKNSALGVKFERDRTPPDQITNMEGAMHTFVTPVLNTRMHGDYYYMNGHGVKKFELCNGHQQAREVIVSAVIQPDFETHEVMLQLSSLKDDRTIGSTLQPGHPIIDFNMKQQDPARIAYDELLRCHLIAHLTQAKALPSKQESLHTIPTRLAAELIISKVYQSNSLESSFSNVFIKLDSGTIISVEVLFNSAFQQLRNELSMLESLCTNGYIYTWDPPAIFARYLAAPILTSIHFAALKHLAQHNSLNHLRAFAFNDYADPSALQLLQHALSTQSHVMVTAKRELFHGPQGTYLPPPGMEGASLVLHNNSDAFGQNIETEGTWSSMDGAIGANSSAAASLLRTRPDLLARKFCCPH